MKFHETHLLLQLLFPPLPVPVAVAMMSTITLIMPIKSIMISAMIIGTTKNENIPAKNILKLTIDAFYATEHTCRTLLALHFVAPSFDS